MNKPQKNWFEWTVFAVGCVLVLGTAGYLAKSAWTSSLKPPAIEIQLGTAELRAGNFVLPIRVINRGDESAEQVHIEVIMKKQNGQQESSDFVIAFVPGRSSREGWVTFSSDPAAAAQLIARPLGYERP